MVWTSWCVTAKRCGALLLSSEDGSHRFVAQVTVYARALGVALAQTTYDTGESSERAALKELLSTLDLGRRTDSGGCPAHHPAVFQWCQEQGADLLLTVKTNQKTLHRQIQSQFQGKRHIPFTARAQDDKHGRDTIWELRAKEAPEHIKENWPGCSWIIQLTTTTVTRKGKRATRTLCFLTTLRTAPEALLRLIRQRWSIENEWHWARDAQLGRTPTATPTAPVLRCFVSENDRDEPAASRWLPLDTPGLAGAGLRHQGNAGPGRCASTPAPST